MAKKEPRSWYKITSGNKVVGGPDGEKLVYRRGDRIELTESQAKASAHQLEPAPAPTKGEDAIASTAPAAVPTPEPVRVSAPEPAPEVKKIAQAPDEESARDEEPAEPAELKAEESAVEEILQGNVGQVAAALEKIDDPAKLRAIAKAEKADKQRMGVQNAVDERLAALKGGE